MGEKVGSRARAWDRVVVTVLVVIAVIYCVTLFNVVSL